MDSMEKLIVRIDNLCEKLEDIVELFEEENDDEPIEEIKASAGDNFLGLPWNAETHTIYDCHDEMVCRVVTDSKSLEEDEIVATAIVKAVNFHDKLIDFVSMIERSNTTYAGMAYELLDEILQKCEEKK